MYWFADILDEKATHSIHHGGLDSLVIVGILESTSSTLAMIPVDKGMFPWSRTGGLRAQRCRTVGSQD
jgi:hypothetical protein